MRQARSKFDRKRRSEPSSSFITISLSFLLHPPVTGLVKKQKDKKGLPT
jgi:hypothetical protein